MMLSGKPSGTYSKFHTRPSSGSPLAIKEKTEFGEAATEWLCPIVDADAQERTIAGNASVEVRGRFRGHSGRIIDEDNSPVSHCRLLLCHRETPTKREDVYLTGHEAFFPGCFLGEGEMLMFFFFFVDSASNGR